MSEELNGKTAIVTGGGQGVGRGIALGLAKLGADIAIVGRTLAKLEKVAKEVEALGRQALPLSANVKDQAALQKMVADAGARFGHIDILVNGAQEVPNGPLHAVTDDAFSAGFESGPLATFRLMKLCHPWMKKAGGGVIINLASSAGVRWDMSNYGAYGSVKQAIRALTRAAAAEWGKDGIRALSIAPLADSPGLEGWIAANPAEAEAFFATIPMRRVGRCVEDIGAAVAALATPAFSYLTGATIPLDGGQANFD